LAKSIKPSATVFDRRTVVVWASLLASLATVSGLLLFLEPVPHAPTGGHVLSIRDPMPNAVEALIERPAEIDRDKWVAIVIHHSGQPFGNAESIGRFHQAHGFGGLGYHFVITNGDGGDDGDIHTGYRWVRQIDGIHNRDAIAICLVGDGNRQQPTEAQMQQLIKLVAALQMRLRLPRSRVLLYSDISDVPSPGALFPATAFRQQLLDIRPAPLPEPAAQR